jgi:hypothetical protein
MMTATRKSKLEGNGDQKYRNFLLQMGENYIARKAKNGGAYRDDMMNALGLSESDMDTMEAKFVADGKITRREKDGKTLYTPKGTDVRSP